MGSLLLGTMKLVQKPDLQKNINQPFIRFRKKPLVRASNRVKLIVTYWNGGGGSFLSRLRANPELINILMDLPDIFVYAESCLYSSVASPLPKYDLLLHTAKRNSCRRGLAVLFLQKYRYCLSKDLSSKIFDILWLKLKNDVRDEAYCFFYAPGQHHPEKMRMELYDELRSGFERYSIDVKIFLLGDSNARLGAYS